MLLALAAVLRAVPLLAADFAGFFAAGFLALSVFFAAGFLPLYVFFEECFFASGFFSSAALSASAVSAVFLRT